MSLLLLLSVVSDAIDVGDVILPLFLALNKAFDTVNYHKLLRQFENYIVGGF